MKKIRPFNTVSGGATQRCAASSMKRLLVLAPAAAASLFAIAAVDCGTYSAASNNGAAGSISNTSGGGGNTSPLGGAPGAGGPSGSSGSSTSGGSVDNTTGGSTQPGDTGGSTAASGGDTTAIGGTGGATSAGGAGGTIAASGGSGGSGAGGSGGGASIALPCGILSAGGVKCVSAHSTVRVIVPGYTGPLYQVCKGTANPGPSSCKGTTQDIGSKDGYADSAAQDTFCGAGACKITKIYDQSGMKNDLEPSPAGGTGRTPDPPADAGGLKLTINGHSAYGILIQPGMGYRTGCSGCNIKTGNGMATGDAPQTMYWVTSQKDLVNSCCFDYGNAETTSNDDGNGTMEALYMGGGVKWGTGAGGVPGPWVEADLEDGLYAGWENKQDKNISTNTPLKYDFVTGIVLGDTADKNNSAGRFALYGGDATTGLLKTMYDGIRPAKPGYVPMKKQGSIILGTGGDNSKAGGGQFYEGAVATGPVASKATLDALQAAIVAVRYGK